MNNTETVIGEFLGAPAHKEGVVDPDSNLFFHHTGEFYQYNIIINIKDKMVQISGDKEFPFGARSLFESSAIYDKLAIEYEKDCYGDRKQLVFRDSVDNILIMIIMWDNKDLSVWRYA
jgi:hypothetical protein